MKELSNNNFKDTIADILEIWNTSVIKESKIRFPLRKESSSFSRSLGPLQYARAMQLRTCISIKQFSHGRTQGMVG